jgi:hypothetical protein
MFYRNDILEAAYHIKAELGETNFKSVEMDITLGFPPHISVGFGSTSASPAVAAIAAHT